MPNATSAVAYRLHLWIRQISPMIWRRLLVRSDSTIADLHYTLQIAFGWSDAHLNLFHIHGQDFGVYQDGGTCFSTHPDQVRLGDFQVRINERFRYEYNFGDGWQHEVCVDAPGIGRRAYLSVLHWRQAADAAGRLWWPPGLHGTTGCGPVALLRNYSGTSRTT